MAVCTITMTCNLVRRESESRLDNNLPLKQNGENSKYMEMRTAATSLRPDHRSRRVMST
jgi:hypothetical protein